MGNSDDIKSKFTCVRSTWSRKSVPGTNPPCPITLHRPPQPKPRQPSHRQPSHRSQRAPSDASPAHGLDRWRSGTPEKAGVKNRHNPIENYAGFLSLGRTTEPFRGPKYSGKHSINETMSGVSDLLTAKIRHTWAHEGRKNKRLRQRSVTLIRSFYHPPIGMESVAASKPPAGARPWTGFQIVPIREYSMSSFLKYG